MDIPAKQAHMNTRRKLHSPPPMLTLASAKQRFTAHWSPARSAHPNAGRVLSSFWPPPSPVSLSHGENQTYLSRTAKAAKL